VPNRHLRHFPADLRPGARDRRRRQNPPFRATTASGFAGNGMQIERKNGQNGRFRRGRCAKTGGNAGLCLAHAREVQKTHVLLVTKDELLSRVWPGIVVAEENLKVQISALRKALGEDRDGPDRRVEVALGGPPPVSL
jgi:hypothetical protein